MKTITKLMVATGSIILFISMVAADAAELKLLSSLAMRSVMDDLGPKFERATGHKVIITFGNLGAIVKRVEGGESADVVIVPRQGIDRLVKDGKAAADKVTALARTGFSVAVRKGGPKPDISSPEALKRTLLVAKSITYANPATTAAGAHVANVLDRLGIASEVKSKTVFPKTGPVGVLVANGEAEIAVHHNIQLIGVSGIEIIGPLPDDLQKFDIFATAIMAGTTNAEASKALVDFLRAPEAAAVIRAKGMEPGAL
jgi:molybdate transport system substrate-binding protein